MSKLMVWEECMVRIATAVEKYVEHHTNLMKQTQEPESKIRGKNWDDPTPMPHAVDEKEPECEHVWVKIKTRSCEYVCRDCKLIKYIAPEEKPAKKECEHDFGFPKLNGCIKCGEEPSMANKNAKKYYEEPCTGETCPRCNGLGTCGSPKKDELAERFRAKAFLPSQTFAELSADEARKWACEVVEKHCPRVDPKGFCVRIDELLKRLKDGGK